MLFRSPVEPTGEHIEWEVINTFRYDDDDRLAEEWVQTDYRSLLTKLGVTPAGSAVRQADRSGGSVPLDAAVSAVRADRDRR